MNELKGPPDIWSLAIMLRGRESTIDVVFSGEDMALKAYGDACNPNERAPCEIADQYGTVMTFVRADIQAVVLKHHSEALKASSVIALMQARAQAQANREAHNDSIINSPLARPSIAMPRG